MLFASFQSRRFYDFARPRWRQLSRGAELAVVFADFDRARTPRDAPAEIPIGRSHPLAREWTVICCAADHAVCLTGWERPEIGPDVSLDRDRLFETIWSVERDVVWDAARICARIAAATAPALIDPVRARLESGPRPPAPAQLRLAAAGTKRLHADLQELAGLSEVAGCCPATGGRPQRACPPEQSLGKLYKPSRRYSS